MWAYLLSQAEMAPCPNLSLWLFLKAKLLEVSSLVGQGVCQKIAGMKLFYLLYCSPSAPYTYTCRSLKIRIPREESLAKRQPRGLWWLQVRKAFPGFLPLWGLLEYVYHYFGILWALGESSGCSPQKTGRVMEPQGQSNAPGKELQTLVTSRLMSIPHSHRAVPCA